MSTVYILLFHLTIVSIWITANGDVSTATESSFFGQNCTWRHNITGKALRMANMNTTLK